MECKDPYGTKWKINMCVTLNVNVQNISAGQACFAPLCRSCWVATFQFSGLFSKGFNIFLCQYFSIIEWLLVTVSIISVMPAFLLFSHGFSTQSSSQLKIIFPTKLSQDPKAVLHQTWPGITQIKPWAVVYKASGRQGIWGVYLDLTRLISLPPRKQVSVFATYWKKTAADCFSSSPTYFRLSESTWNGLQEINVSHE